MTGGAKERGRKPGAGRIYERESLVQGSERAPVSVLLISSKLPWAVGLALARPLLLPLVRSHDSYAPPNPD